MQVPQTAPSGRPRDVEIPASAAAHLDPRPAGGAPAMAGDLISDRMPGVARGRPAARIAGWRPAERKLLQALCDWTIVIGGALPIVLSANDDAVFSKVLVTIALATAFWFFYANAFDAYRLTVLESPSRSTYAALQTYVMMGASYYLIAAFNLGVVPVIRIYWEDIKALAPLVVPLLVVRVLYSLLVTRAPVRRRLAVVGANPTGEEMVEAIGRYGGAAYEFVGFFDDIPGDEASGRREVGSINDLAGFNELLGIDQLVLATHTRTPHLLYALSICHERGIQITPMFALYQDLTGRVPVHHLGNDWFVALPAHRSSSPYMLVKRMFDVGVAALLLLLTLPILPLITLAIRWDSPGPILFRQTRVGRGGRVFTIAKFRSMRVDAEAATGAVWAQRNDPRITRVGRFLRKSRLDELPQLWNVLRGDMSFVGPRPERPEFDAELEERIPFYRARRAVRPGVTGWAQVRHGYGNTMEDALRKVEYDLYYIKHESLYLDLLIMLRTVAVVFKLGGT